MASNISTPSAPIGVFDSGFGGLSILREIRKVLPQYDYIFLGDNARAPYGNRSYQLVYEFTLQAVKHLTLPRPRRCAPFSNVTSPASTPTAGCWVLSAQPWRR